MVYVANRLAARLAVHGETMSLDRAGHISIALKGKRLRGGSEASGNSADQEAFKVRIGVLELDASGWADKVPTAAGDTLTVAGIPRTVRHVDPIGDRGGVVAYVLDVVG